MAFFDANGVELNGSKQGIDLVALHSLLHQPISGDARSDRVTQFSPLGKIRGLLGAVDDRVFGQSVIRKPQEAGDFAFAYLLAQTGALGVAGISIDLDGINGRRARL